MALGPGWAFWPLALLAATRLHALGVVLHEVCHMPPQRGWRLWAVSALAGWPLGSSVAAMRYHHLRHHRDACMPTDPYGKPDLRGRPGLVGLYWLRSVLLWPVWVLRGPLGLGALVWRPLRRVYAALLMDRSGGAAVDSPDLLRCARAEWGQVLAHTLLALALLRWPQALPGLVAPALLASLMSGWRLMQEHTYARATDRRLDTVLAVTRDHGFTALGRLLFAPRNIGYHVVHHLHPQAAKEALPALTAWYQQALGERYPPSRWP